MEPTAAWKAIRGGVARVGFLIIKSKRKGRAGGTRAMLAGPVAIVLSVGSALVAASCERGDNVPGQSAPGRPETPAAERTITAGSLEGAYLSPSEDAPVVLIVPGSGPTDRNGNNPMGIAAAPYRLLAEALAERGIASVRVDKRGLFGSDAAGDPNAVSVDIYAEDYRNWIDQIRSETGQPCVWLLGHSEGSLMVAAAAQGRPDVCGLILVSGVGRPLGDLIREQLADNPANPPAILQQAEAALQKLEAGEHVDESEMHPALVPLFAPGVQDFLISAMAVDPAALVRRANLPTLVVHGTTDIQVSMEDARLLAEAAGAKGRLEVIEGMNHVLKEAPANRMLNIATYMNPALPLSPGLADAIAEFIQTAESAEGPAR